VTQPPKPTPPERPARHGPPVEVAQEVFDVQGQETARLLARVVGTNALESGGRDEVPWVRVERERLPHVAERCRDDQSLRMDMLHLLLAVDYVEHLEVVYILLSTQTLRKAMLKARVPANDAQVPTATHLWEAAHWYEREVHDLFGVTFTGNPDLSPLLLYEGFEGHPGLKSFPFHDHDEF